MKTPSLDQRTAGASIRPPLQKFIPSLFQTPSALIVLLLTLILTVTAWYYTVQNIEKEARARFQHEVNEATEVIQRRIQACLDSLIAARGLFSVHENLTRADWKRYADSLELPKRYPGIRTLVFARYVPKRELAEFEQKVRNDTSLQNGGYPGYSVYPAGERAAYYPIEFVEPSTPAPPQLGFDIGSDPIRLAALERARDTGLPIATGRIMMAQSEQFGFAIRVPIYHGGLPGSVEERRRSLLGFVAASFNMKDLMNNVFKEDNRRDFDFEVFDGGTERSDDPMTFLTPDRLMYDDDQIQHANVPNDRPRYTQVAPIEVAGQNWYIFFSTRPHFQSSIQKNLPFLVLLGGATLSLLLFSTIWSMTTAHQRAIAIAETMTSHLRESEERFRAIFNQAPSGIGVVDPHGRFIQANERLAEILGYTEEELLGRTFQEITHPDDLEINLALRDDLIDGKISKYAIQKRYIHKGGGIVWANLTVSPIRNASGKITHTVAIVEDITDRREAEEKLRKNEAQLAKAQEIAHLGSWSLDLPSGSISWSDELYRIYGLAPQSVALTYDRIFSYNHPEDRDRVRQIIFKTSHNLQPFGFDYRIIRPDGLVRTLHAEGEVHGDKSGRAVRMVGTTQDITERKQAEGALRIKTEQLAAVTDAMTAYLDSRDWHETSALLLRSALHQTQSEYGFIGVVVEGPRLRIMAHEGICWDSVANRSFYEEALRSYRERGFLDFDRFDNLFGEVIRTGKGVVANDVANDPRSGGIPPGHPPLRTFLGVPIIRENEVVGMIGIANRPGGYSGAEQAGIEVLSHAAGVLYDNYRRREREIALENQQRNVENELRRSQEQLRNLSSHLHSVVEEERTRISREIHDELGQLLTILKMELSWLKKRLPKKEALLRDRTKSMAKLVDATVETLRKISTELRPGVLDDLGLTAAVEWQVQEFQNRTGMRCNFTVRPEEILLDPDRSTAVFRIFQETLTNIVRHANADEVAILLEKAEEGLILEVKDNGRGITQNQITNSKSLGLLGIRERALLWGGTVQISGVPGKGTIITVQIPLHQPTDAGKKA